MGETAILELSLGFCAAVMHSTLGFNFKMKESEYRIAMAEGMSAFLGEKLGRSFLVFPNGFAVLLAREADNCWSLSVAV